MASRNSPATRGSTAVTLLQAISSTTIGVLPAYLVGALAVQIRDDLDVSPAEIGIGAAILFGVTAILSTPMGTVVQRRGTAWGIINASILAMLAMLGIAWAPSLPVLYCALVVGGVGNAMAQPAANLGVSAAVGRSRLGLAFGIKQTAVPAATLLSGLAVPGIALILGWRWVLLFAAVAAAALLLWAAVTRGRRAQPASESEGSAPDRGTPRAGLVVITIGVGIAAAAATSLGIFLIDSAVRAGLSPTAAGLMFAVSAFIGLLIRIALGAFMDRGTGRSPYVLVAYLLLGGAAGFVLLAVGQGPWFVVGSLLAYGAGWTWPGLVHFAVVRDNRRAAAAATGILQTGVGFGGAAGPLLFGFLVQATSYGTGWITAACAAVVAAVIFRIGRRMILRSRQLAARAA
ncbi:MFS transporter [Arthrobacter castelli]|uniref:MFS transporter n=1 Tax=Arthrobacter castelli TaxID=271431 RepID=UPI00056A88A6|nr:MFS transporter [Arthrobacter castelli]